MVVLDTCSLIELCLENSNRKISDKTYAEIEKGATILSVSFAEIALKIHLGKLDIDKTAAELHFKYKELPKIEIISIGVQEWLDSIHLRWVNRDPADRLIVAFAKKNKWPIVTTDGVMKKYYKKVLW